MDSPRWLLESGRLVVQTTAEGMFSPLAHDLSLEAVITRGEATGQPDGAGAWSAWVVLPTAELRVAGVRRRGRVERDVLSARDRAEIERKIREELFAGVTELRCEVRGETDAKLEVQSGAVRAAFALRVARRERAEGGESARVEGEATLSLRALGVKPVRGPLGAFRVADGVRVLFETRWKPVESAVSAG